MSITVGNTFSSSMGTALKAAVEVVDDGIGDDDGLCEANEA